MPGESTNSTPNQGAHSRERPAIAAASLEDSTLGRKSLRGCRHIVKSRRQANLLIRDILSRRQPNHGLVGGLTLRLPVSTFQLAGFARDPQPLHWVPPGSCCLNPAGCTHHCRRYRCILPVGGKGRPYATRMPAIFASFSRARV